MSVEIKFGSPRHKRILDAVKGRKELSEKTMGDNHKRWKQAEEQARAYIPETEVDAIRRTSREGGLPQFTTIDLPYSYAMLLAAHTYWTSVFLSRSPVMQYTGRHGETQQQVMAVEALIDYQVHVGQAMVPLYVWLLDAGKYGLGVVGSYWDKEEEVISMVEEVPVKFFGLDVPGKTKKQKRIMRVPGYEGLKLYNVRPQDFFPDPRVPISRLQEGEFCGRYVEVGWNTILKREEKGKYFNVDELKKKLRKGTSERIEGSNQLALPNQDETDLPSADITEVGYVGLFELVVELSPKEWKLGGTSSPEKWVFTLAADSVIIGAEPLGKLHNKFPFFVLEYEVEGYGQTKRSMLEVGKPLNDVMSWLVNTHFYNVRKGLNDQLVVDPSRVVMGDLMDPLPGRLVRMKPAGYGTDPGLAVHQLGIVEMTQNHLRDAQAVGEMLQRILGVNDNLMGNQAPGGRKTATEVRTSTGFGINRLKTNAEYFSAMGWGPLSSVWIRETQQNYDKVQQYKVAGDLFSQRVPFLEVSPESIAGAYDFVPVDGTLPIDRFAQANFWREMLAMMSKIQEPPFGGYSPDSIIAHVGQLSGIKNMERFKVNVVPDEQAQRNAEAGNTVAVGGTDGTNRRGTEGLEGVPGPRQIAGLGPVS